MDFRTILLISHDRYFLDRVCNVMLVFEGKRSNGWRAIFRITCPLGRPRQLIAGQIKMTRGRNCFWWKPEISRLLGEFHRYQVGESAYMDLDRKYQQLLQRKKNC